VETFAGTFGGHLSRVAPDLEAWLPMCGAEWVFPNDDKSDRWCRKGVAYYKQLRAAGDACDVEGLTLESLQRFHRETPSERSRSSPAGNPKLQ